MRRIHRDLSRLYGWGQVQLDLEMRRHDGFGAVAMAGFREHAKGAALVSSQLYGQQHRSTRDAPAAAGRRSQPLVLDYHALAFRRSRIRSCGEPTVLAF
jgi:hypothetical protein